MYNHNKAQQSKNHVHISWDILYALKVSCNIMICIYGIAQNVSVVIIWLEVGFNSADHIPIFENNDIFLFVFV